MRKGQRERAAPGDVIQLAPSGYGLHLDGNTGTFDGYQVHLVVDGWGCGNSFRTNDSDLGGAGGYAINVTDQSD